MAKEKRPDCKEKHLYEYVWGGVYRRCQRCDAPGEWNYGNEYKKGIPCGISHYHSLSAHAVDSWKGIGSSIDRYLAIWRRQVKDGTIPKDIFEKFVAGSKASLELALKNSKPQQIEADIEKSFFLRKKAEAKTL